MRTEVETRPQIKIVVLDNPFEDAHRERCDFFVDYCEGMTIYDVLPERVIADPTWIVVEHGRVIPADEWALRCAFATTELVCFRRVTGAVGRIIAGVFIVGAGLFFKQPWMVAVGAALIVGAAAELIIGSPRFPVPALGNSSSESSPTYGFGGIKNSLRIGAPIQVVYGTHKVAGQLIQIIVRAETTVPNLVGVGTIATHYTEIRTPNYDDNGEVNSITVSDQYVQVVGTGTVFSTALTPGARIRAQGQEFAVRAIQSNTEFHAHYTTQQDLTGANPFTHIRNIANNGDSDILSMLIALSEGPIDSVTDIRIQDQVVANYRGVSTETKLGTNTQTAITLFGDNISTGVAADAAITETYLSYTSAAKNLTAIELVVQWPGGLFTVTGNGGLGTATVDLEIEYKLTSASTFTAFGTASFSDAKRSALRRNIRIDSLVAGQYDVRLRRLSTESTSLTRVDAVRRTSINEIVNDAYTYPNTAILALKVIATDQISGGIPTVTALVNGVQIKIFSSATAFTVAWTDNPAWIVVDMLTNRRYGMGQFVWPIKLSGTWTFTSGSPLVAGTGFTNTVKKGQKVLVWLTATSGAIYTVLSVQSNIQFTLTANFVGSTTTYSAEAHRNDLDFTSFVNWAAFCSALVSDGNGGTEKRATCNLVFDQQGASIWDAVNKVCGLGLASMVKLGNYLTVKYQQAETPVQLFTMANIVANSFSESFLPLDQTANSFEVAYLNASNDYNQEMITLEDPLLYTNSEQEKKQSIQVYGCTRSGHAARLARFYSNANRFLTRTIEFETGIDAIAAEPGDVINFQHDVPQWGFGGRAIAGSTTSTIVMDQSMTVGAGTYNVMVRFSSDDTVQTKTVTNGAGTYTTLTISGTWDNSRTPAKGDVFAFGVIAILTKPFRIIAIERTPEFNGKISAIEYNASLYDETNLLPVNVVQYSSLPDLSGPPPQVTDLAIVQLNDNTIAVTFSPPTDSRYKTTYLYRMVDGRSELIGESRNGSLILTGYLPGELVAIRAVAVSYGGVQASIDASPFVALNVAIRAIPPTITGLELLGQGNDTAFLGKDAKFDWKRTAIDSGIGTVGLGHELNGAGSGISTIFKNYRIEIYNTDNTTLRRREYTLNPVYIYSYENNYEDAQRMASGAVVRAFIIKVWAEDIYNQLSLRPATLSVSNAAPAILSNFVATATALSILASWDKAVEIDRLGYVLHRSTSSGFTPSSSTLIYNGPSTVVNDENLTIGTTYYYKVAAYDTFDETTLNYSGQVSASPLGLAQSQFFPGLRAIEIVAVLPVSFTNYPNGTVVALTTDNKLYRSTGSAWTVAVPAADVTGQMTDAQLAAIAAAKVTGQIITTQITDLAISTPKLAAGAVTAAKITANTITAAEIAALTITGAQIAAGAITAAKITAGTITANEILANSLTTATLAAGAVTATELASNAVTAVKITAGAIVAGKIAVNAITAAGAEIADVTIGTAKIIDANVTTAKIASANITTALIASANITTALIASANITTALIANANITTALISSANITTALIGDLNVTSIKIANNSVTNRASSTAAGPTTGAATDTTALSISITTTGGSVLIICRSHLRHAIASSTANWKLKRDSTVLDTLSYTGDNVTLFNDFASLFAIDTPTAGTYTYALTVQSVSGDSTATVRSSGLYATEFLK